MKFLHLVLHLVFLRISLGGLSQFWKSYNNCNLQALREIDDLLKYLDRAESELSAAEPISANPDILTIQLREHKVSRLL